MSRVFIFVLCAVVFISLRLPAQDPEFTEADSASIEERLNPPELTPEEDITPYSAAEASSPSFINLKANKIDLNGDDWTGLHDRFLAGVNFGRPFTVLHIGDSHIQADAATGTTRRLMQNSYGNAGRGLITPLKMAGTNEPRDYRFTSSSRWVSSKLMKTPWESPMMFTGVSVTPTRSEFDLAISTLSSSEIVESLFRSVTLFYQGDITVDSCSSDGKQMFFTCDYGKESATLHFHNAIDNVQIFMHTDGSPSAVHFAGAELVNSDHGVLYNTIGNNGAMYMSYNALDDFHRISQLRSDLVLVALGANEAYGIVSDTTFESMVDRMVRRVHQALPDAKIVLVTPMESQKRATVRRRRRRRKASTSYTINADVSRLRNVIVAYGKKNHIPVYDLYQVAGGYGSSEKWLTNGLLNPRDRIHLTWPGYELQGRLTYDALVKALDSK